MRIRIKDRFLVAIAGLILIACAAAAVLEAFFGFKLAEAVHAFVTKGDILHIAITVAASVIVLLLGLYCFCFLFRRSRRAKSFVMQKTEAGELSISVKALEGLVNRCLEKHDELNVSKMWLSNSKKGLNIHMIASLATGVNIPLTVSNVQKQVKQYVTSCSGVDVNEVRVQVDTTSGKPSAKSNFVEEEPQAPAKIEQVEVPDVVEETPEEEKRPFHQRLFGTEEQPMMIPEPPAEAPVEQQEIPEPAIETLSVEDVAEDQVSSEVKADGE